VSEVKWLGDEGTRRKKSSRFFNGTVHGKGEKEGERN